MFRLRMVPAKTNIPFMGARKIAFGVSGLLAALSIVVLVFAGLNLGIDFRGGIMVEVKTPGQANLSVMRSALSGLGLGEIALQEFGAPDDVLIRIERQAGDSTAQQKAVEVVKEALGGCGWPRDRLPARRIRRSQSQRRIWFATARSRFCSHSPRCWSTSGFDLNGSSASARLRH